MASNVWEDDVFVDANDCPAERMMIDGVAVIVHHRDVPDSDLTEIQGVPCTTALRTVIDLASQLDTTDLANMVRHCLDRGLFTLDEAWARIAEPDMLAYPGALSLRRFLMELEGST